VTVPLVTQTDVVRAYDLLRAAGLRVSIRSDFAADSLWLLTLALLPRSRRRLAQEHEPARVSRIRLANVTRQKAALSGALNGFAGASTRGAVQVLGGILLQAEPGRLSLAATDMAISIRASLEGEVEGDDTERMPSKRQGTRSVSTRRSDSYPRGNV
jgi:hypothetical protein